MILRFYCKIDPWVCTSTVVVFVSNEDEEIYRHGVDRIVNNSLGRGKSNVDPAHVSWVHSKKCLKVKTPTKYEARIINRYRYIGCAWCRKKLRSGNPIQLQYE